MIKVEKLCSYVMASIVAVVLVLIAGPVCISTAEAASVISHGDRRAKKIALTFDDGYNCDARILDFLESRGIKATAFVIGGWARKNPELIRRMDDDGWEVCNHTETHASITKLTNDQILAEINACQGTITSITGKHYPYFRPPYGDFDARTLTTVEKAGYKSIYWDVSSSDTSKGVSPGTQVAMVLNRARGGSIVLMHFGGYNTATILPKIVDILTARGYEFVTMSQLLGDKAEEDKDTAIEVDAGADQTVNEGDIVEFSGSIASANPVEHYTYIWDFGDGSEATSTLSTLHVYKENGVYAANLTVKDANGVVGADSSRIVVNNVAPAATVTNNGPVQTGVPVIISVVATDPGADILSYSFDWDNDGIYDQLDQASSSASHVYADAGTHNAIIRVVDDDGAASTYATQVVIGAITVRDMQVMGGLQVTATATTLGTSLPGTTEQLGGSDPPLKKLKAAEEVQSLPYTGLDLSLFVAIAAGLVGTSLILHNRELK